MSRQRKEFRMYEKEEFTYLSRDGRTKIRAIAWKPVDQSVRAVLQIAHGMVEHIERYEEFAGYLAEYGIVTVGNDHLGHGKSIASTEDWGFFAEEEGNRAVIQDMHTLRKKMILEYPQVPYFLLGHSMGSFLARQYLCCYGAELKGAIISGTGWHSRMESWAGMALTKVMAGIFGWHYRSVLIDRMAFGGYNRWLKNPRTEKDWLSKEEVEVDRYLADPACTFRFTLNGYYNMFAGLYKIASPEYVAHMPKDLPVLFVAGEDDPVGDFGKGVKKAADSMKKAGVTDISLKLYEKDRHEILKETDRETVFQDIYRWIEAHMA